jgi:hypothetical protein
MRPVEILENLYFIERGYLYAIDAQSYSRGGVFCAADGHHLVQGDRRSLL